MKAVLLAAVLSLCQALSPRVVPKFVIDFDVPAINRYTKLYQYFKPTLQEMEDYWWHVIPPNLRTFFQSSENIELYAKNNQDQFYAMVSLSQEIERPLEQVLTVNSVTEISTYCTSIVARTLEGGISHVRNLDFGATALMTKLVYEQVLVRDGLEKATAPSIAGYYGAYTGQVPGQWSVSYNVRETVVYPTEDVLQANLQRTLDPDYVELWVLIQDLLLSDVDFNEAVKQLQTRWVTSVGFVIVGGLTGNEGVVIARDPQGTNHTNWLSDEQWFVAQTNRDVWEVTDDARYNATVQSMNNLGQIGVEHDGTQMIEKVLWSQGVLQFETIFTSTQTAFSAQRLNIYDPPNKSGALGPSTPPMTYIKQ